MGYEYQNKPSNDYYPIGTTYVKVRAKDRYGKFSDWYTVDVTISNSAPEAPTIYRDPDTISIAPGSSMTLTATSTDPDGDAVHFEWEGVTDDGRTQSESILSDAELLIRRGLNRRRQR